MNTYYIGGMPVTDELYHHGILGQKWGVRRYQNPDGTLTPAGKKRYHGFGFSSTIPRGELTEKGKQKYGDDPSLMSKGKLKRQFYRNQAYGNNKETRKVDKEMNKYFKETKDPYDGRNYLKTYAKIDQYVTDMARARLKDMGYTPNDKAVDYLRNQPWFFKTVPLSYMLPPDKQPH